MSAALGTRFEPLTYTLDGSRLYSNVYYRCRLLVAHPVFRRGVHPEQVPGPWLARHGKQLYLFLWIFIGPNQAIDKNMARKLHAPNMLHQLTRCCCPVVQLASGRQRVAECSWRVRCRGRDGYKAPVRQVLGRPRRRASAGQPPGRCVRAVCLIDFPGPQAPGLGLHDCV